MNNHKYSGITCKGCYAFGSACGKCERCKNDPLNPANVTPKASDKDKAEKMLWNIRKLAEEIVKYAHRASISTTEYTRDRCIDKIIKLNEEIEELYSTNWH